jgi:hypothetical protein
MTCLFADPLVADGRGRPPRFTSLLHQSASRMPASPTPASATAHLLPLASAAAKPRARRMSEKAENAAWFAATSVPYREVATPEPQPFLQCCPAHVTRVAASLTDRALRRTDEASRSQVGKPSAGSSGFVGLRFRASGTPELCCGPRRRGRLGSIPKANVVVLGPQSKRFFAGLKCGRVMADGAFQAPGRCAASARGMPARSCETS